MDTLPTMVRGDGPPDVVLLPGFGMTSWAYHPTVQVASRRCRVIVADWERLGGFFTPKRAVDAIIATLDREGVERATLFGHSYSGSLALGVAATAPERVERLVIAESAGLAASWRLAWYARPGRWIFRLATFRSAVGFMHGAMLHPLTTTSAALHGFFHDTTHWIRAVRDTDIPCHVLWAERDTLLPREHGRAFAEQLDASFTIVTDPFGEGPVDHDWVWRHPQLLEDHLDRIGVLRPYDPQATAERIR